MREIKFRGIKKENEGFIYGCYHKLGDQHLISDGSVMSSVIKKTIGQYTGLKDKNDKEIYEGDVVKYYKEELSYVIFSYGCFCIKGMDSFHLTNFCEMNELCEIIGNIHENPELLKGDIK